ncbi:MAG: hypothetical protein CVU46_11255 [Chloroflexi bacterium HGW-Chloroflexi-8]|nr:MAG: hypothetical protein CVU46_11255 [Chloroflexi bacterium HGW-Chloroflexi-8]
MTIDHFSNYCLGVDVSYYQTSIDWLKFQEGGVRFAIIRASQGNYLQDTCFHTHLQGAQQAGMICGAYHYFELNCSVSSQVNTLKAALGSQDVSFLALDVEQYWKSWAKDLRSQKDNHFSSQFISQSSREMAERMRETWQKPVLIYTRASFVSEYAPHMSDWLPEWPLWIAHYPYSSTRKTVNWEQLKKDFAPPIPNPWLPQKCSGWKFWQFSGDKFSLPGVNHSPLDLNFYNGSLQDLQTWLNLPLTPRELTFEQKIALLWQAHPQLWQEENHHG